MVVKLSIFGKINDLFADFSIRLLSLFSHLSIILAISIPFGSCIFSSPSKDLKPVLNHAGKNKWELLRVLHHFSNDSLKFKAACFLIKNMEGHFYSYGLEEKLYNDLAINIDRLKKKYPIGSASLSMILPQLWDSLQSNLQTKCLSRKILNDLQTINAEMLIENIDYAFAAWRYPWAEHLNFDQFCEYLLPYRYGNEVPEFWRKDFFNETKWLADSMNGRSDPLLACKYINNYLSNMYSMDEFFQKIQIYPSASQLIKMQMGTCFQQTAITTLIMRAAGIPVTIERIDQWGNHRLGHSFNGVLNRSGVFIPFQGVDTPPDKFVFRNTIPKISRVCFSVQSANYLCSSFNKDVNNFNSKLLKDVTKEYEAVSDIVLTTTDSINFASDITLCLFNNSEWVKRYPGIVEDRKIVFKEMGRNICYLPKLHAKKSDNVSSIYPFILQNSGKINILKPDIKHSRTIVLNRKYPPNKDIEEKASHMIGGRFQGANKPDFSDAINLFSIQNLPAPYLVKYPINTNKKFRYVRYLFPHISENKFGNVSEIKFFNKTKELVGKRISPDFISEFQRNIVFDFNLTNFVTAWPQSQIKGFVKPYVIQTPDQYVDNVWIGMDFGHVEIVNGIAFCPRNDTNGIYPGSNYELFYWDDKWISLGQKSTDTYKIQFSNVPNNSLLWLRNNTEGKEERIFTYENGKQNWW